MQLTSPHLRQLYDDWTRWRGTRPFPKRDDLDPLGLKYILDNLSVVDVSYNPLRFHFRVHASARVEQFGFDLTGKNLDLLPDDEYRQLMRLHLTEALKRRAPVTVTVEGVKTAQFFGRLEVLILPFSSNGQTIDLLAVGTHLTTPPHLRAHQAAQETSSEHRREPVSGSLRRLNTP